MDEFYCGEETEDFFAELFFREEKPKGAFIPPKVLRKFRRFRKDSEMPKDEDGDYEVGYGWTSQMNQLLGKRLPDDFAFHEHVNFYIRDDMAFTALPKGVYLPEELYTYVGNWIVSEEMTIVVEEWVPQ